jgi:ribonuclease P/MRP protein subunit POP3
MSFGALMDAVPTLRASWLTSPAAASDLSKSLVPTHIKQVRTSAPKDMKLAKEQRTKSRAEAKERRKRQRRQR